MTEWTTDTFFNGKITVRQPLKGYRYSIDAVILAGCVRAGPQDRILDLGTGCGIIPLIITHHYPGVRLIGVELQRELAELARQNVAENKLDRCIDIWNMDMKDLDLATFSEPVDMVVTNPPFYRVSSGRINPNSQRAIARHELKANLADVLTITGRLLKTGGTFVCIYPVDRLVDLFCRMRSSNIEPKSARTIHARARERARLVLVEGVKRGNPGLSMASPLMIYNSDGNYTSEVGRMFEPTSGGFDVEISD